MSRLKLTLRGCGTLPHVGSHPGTGILIALTSLTAATAIPGGLWPLLSGGLMVGGLATLYLVGAYERAVLSVRLQRASADCA